MADVVLKDVWKKYGSVEAVKGLSFEVKDGELLGILGPSGAGKTSTLKLIAGVIPLTSGEIYIDHKLANALPTTKRDVAMIFESYALYPHMSVYDNLAFPLRAPGRRLSNKEIDDRVRWALDLLHIPELADRRPRELSSGQKQRVSVGRALVRQPAVYLMDEPISHLDAKLRHFMRAELKKIMEETLSTSAIYVTHDYTEVMSLASKVIVIDKGEMKQIGTPHDIFNRPASQFVAHAVGSPPTNMLRCHVISENDALYLEEKDGNFRLPVPGRFKQKLHARKEGDVILGIRPMHVSFSAQPSGQQAIQAEVYVFEPLGAIGILTVKIGEHLVQISTGNEIDMDIGDRVWLGFDSDSLHIFDAKSTLSILL